MFPTKLILYKSVIVIVLVLLQRVKTNMYTDVMLKLSYSFGMALLECGDMGNATNSMEVEVYNYWNIDYNINHISTGCLVLCSMAKLDLLDEEGKLKVDNAEGYLRANGGDDEIVLTLLNLYTKCRETPRSTTQPCEVSLEMSKCFRKGIRDLQWIPDISSLISQNTITQD